MSTEGINAVLFQPETEWERYIQEGPMEFSPQLVARLEEEIAERKRTHPNSVGQEKFVDVPGSIGSACYASPNGYAFTSFWNTKDPQGPDIEDHSFHGRTTALILGSDYLPELITALPKRPPQAVDCATCQRFREEGWIGPEVRFMYCHDCAGLGWLVPGYDQTPYQPPPAPASSQANLLARLLRWLCSSQHFACLLHSLTGL